MRKLLALLLLCILVAVLTFFCGRTDRGLSAGNSSRGAVGGIGSARQNDGASLRKFGRSWRDRYCEKTLRKIYGLSAAQLRAMKRELTKKEPSLTTKATQSPPVEETPATSD